MLNRPPRRIRFVECRVRETDSRVVARVALVDGGTPVEGTAERASGAGAVPWVAAEATLNALWQAYGLEPDQVRLKDVVLLEIDGRPAVAASIVTTVGGERRSLFGLSGVAEDEGKAAALAVLGATNRFFGKG
jgi:hypothetical protein